MNKCCNVSNPLRRDGASQKQRFAQALAETYVQIDERSHADILNFTLGLSREINYYDENNTVSGTSGWLDFFQSDASFILADLYLLDIEAYKSEFTTRMQVVQEFYNIDPENFQGVDELKYLIKYFLGVFTSPLNGQDKLTPFPLLLDSLIDMLPDSSLFSDESLFSFRDLVMDSRKRLSSVLNKLKVAHTEATYSYLAMTNDPTGWDLLSDDWNLVPFADPSPNFTYFTTDTARDIPKILELLQICQDTFVGIMENLKVNVPIYLEQSLGKYPWHEPQNGLFLSFLQLFDYAKTHINRLGRKHLLYFYEDVLRFSAQAAVPDQAALIFQLRKGVTRHLIEAGTLLKAGKDPDGKALYYEVPEENVLNQAAVKALKTVYVERTPIAPLLLPPAPASRVINIYASPIANSADGVGAALDKDEPKWNMFGEPQSLLSAGSHTMPDAEVGLAIASPILVLHEGQREIMLTFWMDKLTNIGDYIVPTVDKSIAAREYAILNGLKATYTAEKGWADATIASVFLITKANQKSNIESFDPTTVIDLPTGMNYATGFLLCIKVVLDEHDKACLPYQEAVHAAGMDTEYPVLKLTVEGRTASVDDLNINLYPQADAVVPSPPPPPVSVPSGSLILFGGTIYKFIRPVNGQDNTGLNLRFLIPTINPTKLVDYFAGAYAEALIAKYTVHYDKSISYSMPTSGVLRVMYDGVVYELIATYSATDDPTPNPKFWKIADLSTYVYDFLAYFVPKQSSVRVNVSGVTGVVLENDAGRLKANKPFQPFGAIPTIGARFYIGSQEIFGKKLDKLSVTFDWQDMPVTLASYFSAYLPSSPVTANDVWAANTSMLIDGKWVSLGSKSLFDSNNATAPHSIEFTNLKYARDLSLVEPSKLETTSTRGFFRLELAAPSMAFGHKAYRDLYVKESFRVAAAIANKPTASASTTPVFPNEPFSPTVKDFKISYSSKVTIDMSSKVDDLSSYNNRVEQFFHVHPFGHTEEHPYLHNSPFAALLPKLPEEGYLYMGIEGLEPPSTLSLLYQLVEGSGNPDMELHTPKWSFLSNNNWVDLDAKDILTDTTVGMITSGVMRYNLKTEMSTGNTLLDSDLHWMRAKVDVNVPANLKVIDILAQAVVVKFADQGNNLAHLAKSLPQGTINGLKINDPEVKKVVQPYGSTGGKLPEQSDAYLTRVSERLRHKQRSINVWDYERMVLEAFPDIYKVKCLNHTELQVSNLDGADWEISPGHVTMICIPDLRNRNAVNPFEPKTSVHTLKEVDTYLRKYISNWVDLRVANPLYEQLKITCKIGFIAGRDPGFYIGQLEQAIQQFLSPWAFDHQEEIVFGNSVHRSQIIRFIEQQDYVDYVISFAMDHIKGVEIDTNVAEAKATTGRSIIVSALKHTITSGDATCTDCDKTESGNVETTTCCEQLNC